MATWLVKTEPSTYAFGDLVQEGRTAWSGVKNALARRHLAAMEVGDEVVVYHSGAKQAVGLASVALAAYPDPAGGAGAVCVDLLAGRGLARPVALAELAAVASFAGSPLLTQGRLSVLPITAAQRRALLALAGRPARPARTRKAPQSAPKRR
jgi:predicted RNA-binding protein with PUA-like domain